MGKRNTDAAVKEIAYATKNKYAENCNLTPS